MEYDGAPLVSAIDYDALYARIGEHIGGLEAASRLSSESEQKRMSEHHRGHLLALIKFHYRKRFGKTPQIPKSYAQDAFGAANVEKLETLEIFKASGSHWLVPTWGKL